MLFLPSLSNDSEFSYVSSPGKLKKTSKTNEPFLVNPKLVKIMSDSEKNIFKSQYISIEKKIFTSPEVSFNKQCKRIYNFVIFFSTFFQ